MPAMLFRDSLGVLTYLTDKRLSSVSTGIGDRTDESALLLQCRCLFPVQGDENSLDFIVGMQQIDMFLYDRLCINIRPEKEEETLVTTQMAP